MHEAKVSADFMMDGVAIWVSTRPGDGIPRRILRITGETHNWDDVDGPGGEIPATLRLPDDAARALLDALLSHYQGTSDLHTVRSDLLHERDRVDRLLGVVCQIAARP